MALDLIRREGCALLIVDFQERLMPAIADGAAALGRAQFLADAARLLAIPTLVTEQNPGGLGPTVAALETHAAPVVAKTTFDATRADGFWDALGADASAVVVAGCEAHVCVLQTCFRLLAAGRRVHLVEDAIGSRDPANKAAAVARLRAAGADVVTSEMVAFEWIEDCKDRDFKALVGLVKSAPL